MTRLNCIKQVLVPEPLVGISRAFRNSARRIGRRFQLKIQAKVSRPLRIVLGSGGVPMQGWLVTDIDQLNILVDQDWRRFFVPNSLEAILAEHVWEHLSAEQGLDAARLCFRYLRTGGRLRVAVPDGLHPDPAYIDAVKPGGGGPGADDHKALYTYPTLRALFENAGFTTRALEYFDEGGAFHAVEWSPADGIIRRSVRFDDRNQDGQLRYTSIIIDAIKPES